MQFFDYDDKVLLLCEDLKKLLNEFKENAPWSEDSDIPFQKRLDYMEKIIASEQRLIEEISLPGRFIVEHFTMIQNVLSSSMGFHCQQIQSGRGTLADVSVGEWGTILVKIGNVEISWRDQDVRYLFYPDQIVVRPKDSGKDEITFFFSYSFKYVPGHVKKYQAVKDDPQTAYWHESLNV